MQLRDERVVAALFILLQFFFQKQPSLLPEGLWLLNNLTGMHHNLPRPGHLDNGDISSWPRLRWIVLAGVVGESSFSPWYFSSSKQS